MEKKCWQKSNPDWQTSCYQEAGGTSCSGATCAIENALPNHPVYMANVEPIAKESAIRCWVLQLHMQNELFFTGK